MDPNAITIRTINKWGGGRSWGVGSYQLSWVTTLKIAIVHTTNGKHCNDFCQHHDIGMIDGSGEDIGDIEDDVNGCSNPTPGWIGRGCFAEQDISP